MEKLLTLGIDWQSIVIYLVNFGILYFIVAKYLVPRVVGFLDKREKTIKDNIDEANKLKEEFQAKLVEMEKEQEEIRAHQLSEMQEFKKDLDAKRDELIEIMEKERQEMLEKTEHEIAQRKEMLMKEVETEMLTVIQNIVLNIVQNKLPKEVVSDSIQDAWKQYKN